MEANEESLYRRRERLSLQYVLQLKSMPNHPTHKTIQPKYTAKFAAKPSAIPTYGIRTTNLLNDSNIKLELCAFALKGEHNVYSLVPNIAVCMYIDQK